MVFLGPEQSVLVVTSGVYKAASGLRLVAPGTLDWANLGTSLVGLLIWDGFSQVELWCFQWHCWQLLEEQQVHPMCLLCRQLKQQPLHAFQNLLSSIITSITTVQAHTQGGRGGFDWTPLNRTNQSGTLFRSFQSLYYSHYLTLNRACVVGFDSEQAKAEWSRTHNYQVLSHHQLCQRAQYWHRWCGERE